MKRIHTIGFEADCVYDYGTGPSNHARSIIEAIAMSGERNAYLRLYTTHNDTTHREESLDKIANIEIMLPDGSVWRKLTKIWSTFGISRDAYRGGVELFHALNNELPYGLTRRDIRSVVTVHDLMFLRYPRTINPLDKYISRIKLQSSCKRADRIIAVSKCTKNDIIELLGVDPEKIDVVYPSCNRTFTEEIMPERVNEVREKYELPKKYILNVGRQRERKNVELILEAMTKLDNETHLVVAGNKTSHTNRLRRHADKLNISNRVHFVHNADNHDLAAIYRGADLLVCPTHYSSFGMPIVEAQSMGIPVIAATGSSHEEAGGDAALYVSPNNSAELAEKIDAVLNNTELRDTMIKRGKVYTSRFRPEVIAYNITNSYKRIGVNLMDMRVPK